MLNAASAATGYARLASGQARSRSRAFFLRHAPEISAKIVSCEGSRKIVDQPVTHESDHRQVVDQRRSLLGLAAMALIVGAATGCVGAVFRLLLAHADRLRDAMIAWAHGHAILGFLIVAGSCAVANSVALTVC